MTTSELANISTNTSVFFVHLISARRVHVKSIFQYGGKCSITAALTWGQKLERLKSIMLYHCAYSKPELISARHTCIDRTLDCARNSRVWPLLYMTDIRSFCFWSMHQSIGMEFRVSTSAWTSGCNHCCMNHCCSVTTAAFASRLSFFNSLRHPCIAASHFLLDWQWWCCGWGSSGSFHRKNFATIW